MNLKNYISSGILELYVFNLLSDTEKKEVETNMDNYTKIKEEVNNIQDALENYLYIYLTTTPPNIWDKIQSEIRVLNKPK